jgi:serine protease inhibitor
MKLNFLQVFFASEIPLDFTIDRPFMYMLVDDFGVVFMGKVVELY